MHNSPFANYSKCLNSTIPPLSLPTDRNIRVYYEVFVSSTPGINDATVVGAHTDFSLGEA